MNKNILSVILFVLIILSFCSCSFKKNIEEPSSTSATSAATTEAIVPDSTAPTEPSTELSEETSTSKKADYDKEMYEGLSDEERELIIGALGEDFKFEGVDELSSKEISKIIKYARTQGKRVKIRNEKLVITDLEGNTVTTVAVTWPGSKLLELLPPPQFGKMTLHSGDDNEYAVTITDFTESNIQEYTKLLTGAGFSQGIEQINDLDNGVYNYSASRSDGVSVNLSVVTPDCLVITVKSNQ